MGLYLKYFGLHDPPFSITPDPRYLYLSARHREALAHLFYGIQEKGGFVLLTGEVGTGKTMVTRALLSQLPEATELALIFNPMVSAVELLEAFCDELKIGRPEQLSVKGYFDHIASFLLRAYSEHKRVVLLIDEAQNLAPDVIEQIRLLTNLETATEKLLQIILVGQPELTRMLSADSLRQVSQRITARYHLDPLGFREVNEYLSHRLFIAGAERSLFTFSARLGMWWVSGGVPRLVNIIADRALLGAYAKSSRHVSLTHVLGAAYEVKGRRETGRRIKGALPKALKPVRLSVQSLILLMIVGVGAFFLVGRENGEAIFSHLINDPAYSVEESLRPDALALPEKSGTLSSTTDALFSDEASSRDVGEAKTDQSGSVFSGSELQKQSHLAISDVRVNVPSSPSVVGGASKLLSDTENESENENESESESESKSVLDMDLAFLDSEVSPSRQGVSAYFLSGLDGLRHLPALRTDLVSAFTDLLRLWGEGYAGIAGSTGCAKAANQGLQCYFMRGNLEDIIFLKRPVIARLSFDSIVYYAVVVAIDDAYVVLSFDGLRYRVPFTSEVWAQDLQMIVLWRPPSVSARVFKPGMDNASFAWFAELLHQVDPLYWEQKPEEYDASVQSWVRQYQASRSLTVDGIAGEQTLVYLLAEIPDNTQPTLMIRPKYINRDK
jgi:general secretion pathway protein A